MNVLIRVSGFSGVAFECLFDVGWLADRCVCVTQETSWEKPT